MLTSTNFWLGVGVGVLAVYGYHKYSMRKSSGGASS